MKRRGLFAVFITCALSLCFALSPPAWAQVATLVRTTDASLWSPPSPDSAGIVYLDHSDTLLVSDSEVNEIDALFTGNNLFETDLSSTLLDTLTTIDFSGEPTGVAYNPANQHLFFSDDNKKEIFELDPGPDGLYDTPDDIVTSFDTVVFGNNDPEGITYNTALGVLHIADGVNEEVYTVHPGPNGVFDGVPADGGDDQVTSFDTTVLGVVDPEGIAYDSDFGHLYIAGKPNTQVVHVTTTGVLVRMIDVSAANANKLSGLAYAPSSVNPGEMNLYIVDRGVDNNSDPNENDGKVYELSLPLFSGNALPTVTITAPANGSTFEQGDPITFTGTATDAEDGDVTGGLAWSSSLDGNIGAGGLFSTNTLSLGTHTITASVTDSGGLQGSDAITVTVNPEGLVTLEVRVAVGSDDAEERETGSVSLTSSDLELVFDKPATGDQTVGMRFNTVTIPLGASIVNASVQFQVDETSSGATSLTIEGEATDNAATFINSSGNISSRSTTASFVSWDPVPWTTKGEAGPDQQTPDLASIIQEIVNRSGWSSGNSLGIIITGTGERTAESFNGDPNGAPLLHVDYFLGSNTAPTASAVVITGTPAVGQVLTGTYTYDDADGDAEGTSTYRWLRDTVEISGATLLTYTLVAADETTSIVFEVTPVAATGVSLGAPVTSPAVGPVTPVNDPPVAVNDDFTSTPVAEGGTLTGLNVLTNDTDTDGTLNVTSVTITGQTNGVATADPVTGLVDFTHDGSETTVASFTYTVNDDLGAPSNEATVSLAVTPANDSPVAEITAPADGSSATEGQSVSFSGTATDAEDGDLTASLVWTSSLDGSIGTGGSFSTSTLSVGTHTITAQVTDSLGASGSDAITLTVTATPSPVQVLTPAGSNGYSTLGGQNQDKHLEVTVTLVDSTGAPVAGATVSATIDGPKAEGGTRITDASGEIIFKIRNAPSGTYTTTVTDVTATGHTWDGTTPLNSFDK